MSICKSFVDKGYGINGRDSGCGTPDDDTDLDTISDCNDRCPGEDDLLDQDANARPDCLEEIPIPTLSTWGMVIMAVLLLAVDRRVYGTGSSRHEALG